MNAPSNSPLIRKLLASAPTTEYGEAINLYGFLPGSWETDGIIHRPDGGRVEKRGEIHAGWILGGRAIQDVWALPTASMARPCASTIRRRTPGTFIGTIR